MLFDHVTLNALLRAMEEGRQTVEVSPDLGLSSVTLAVSPEAILIPGGELGRESILQALRKARTIVKLESGELRPLALFANGYYQLVATGEAPTVEIDGIQMHRTKKVKPFEDARQKVSAAVRKGDIVLDACGGLGYTAIWAIRHGAARVDSCEPNPSIRFLRGENPWSQEFSGERIHALEQRAEEFIESCVPSSYDSILHDPPRFSLAGELYSGAFYRRFYEVLKTGGRLFHYTGDPYSHGRQRKFIEGIVRRLSEARFKVSRAEEVLGVLAIK